MIQLAIFDWNGTILDDLQITIDASNVELAVLGIPPVGTDKYVEMIEIPLINYYKKLGISETVFKKHTIALAKAYHEYYEPLAAKARTRRGTRACLKYLQAKNIQLIILSNHTVEGIYLQLNRLKMTHYFDAVLANDEIHGSHLLGKEARLKEYLDSQNYSPDEVVIIGDTIEEIGIGKKFGLKTIAISGGINSVSRLQRGRPDVLASSMAGIVEAIKEF
jgi:phosphoglycolate phosphatase